MQNRFFAKLRRFCSRHWLPLFIAAALVVSAYYGIERIFDVDFICTNGDYQNYNVLRRFLAGQTPYFDFANYLGMGLLVLCAPALALHNSFAGSLFVTNTVAALLFILLVALVFYLVTGNRTVSVLVGLAFPKLLSSKFLLALPGVGYYTDYYLGLVAKPMNSFRIGRLALAVLLTGAALLVCRYVYRRRTLDRKDASVPTLRSLLATPSFAALTGFVVGLGLTWSNDFGFACIGSATVVLLILAVADGVQQKQWKSLFVRFLWYLPMLMLGALCSILLASCGHIDSWFSFTSGVGSWQFHYYGQTSEEKLLVLGSLWSSPSFARFRIHVIVYIGCMGYSLYQLCRQRENDRLILFVFLFTTVFAAHVAYIVACGTDGFGEGTYSLVILLFWALLVKFGLWALQRFKVMRGINRGALALIAVYLGYVGLSDVRLIRQYNAMEFATRPDYVAQLGGVHPQAEALKAMAEIVGTESLFSTYATALDDICGQFQPTGCDYIIHALGDDAFQAYVNTFTTQNYTFVQTTNPNIWPWEHWTLRASWDFYRELLSNYRVEGDHAFWRLWRYEGEDAYVSDQTAAVRSVTNADGSVTLYVTSEETRPCYVDVALDWRVTASEQGGGIPLHRVLFVEDPALQQQVERFDGFFLPQQGEWHHLPVCLENGEGSVTLRALPSTNASLQLENVQVGEIILRP